MVCFLGVHVHNLFICYRLIHILAYGNQTDKAVAANGRITLPFLNSKELVNPRVLSSDLNDIILGKGDEYLSPERRLDATLYIQTLLDDRSKNE